MAGIASIRVRAMVARDLDAVARLLVESGLCRRRGLRRRLETTIRACPPLCLVAESGRRPVGVLLGSFNGFHALLSHIAVAGRFRGLGAGRRLHSTFVRRARRLGARGSIADARLTSAGFFHRLGYRTPGAVFLIKNLG